MLKEKVVGLIKYLSYLAVFLLPLIYLPTGVFPFQIIKITFFQALVEVILALWLALMFFSRDYRPKLTLLFWSLVLFAGILVISGFLGADFKMSLWSDEQRNLGIIAILHFIVFSLALSTLFKEKDWHKLWFLSFVSAFLVSLIGISQKFITVPIGTNSWFYILYPLIPERIGSTFSNPAYMAGYLLFNLFIGSWLFIKRIKELNFSFLRIIRDFKTWVLFLGIIILISVIFLSETIGVISGIFLGFIALFVWLIVDKNKLRDFFGEDRGRVVKKIIAGIMVFIVIFSGAFWVTRQSVFWQILPGFGKVASSTLRSDPVRDRLLVWKIGLEAYKDNPISGVGLENFRIAFGKHYDPNILVRLIIGTNWDKPHNVILEYLVTTGILGLIIYLNLWLVILYCLFRRKSERSEDFYQPFFGAMLLGYFWQNLFIFDTFGTYLMFFLVIAFLGYRHHSSLKSSLLSNKTAPINNSYFKLALTILILTVLFPVFYNYKILKASNYEYWGINYFLNTNVPNNLSLSEESFRQAIKINGPYSDDIKRNFANTVQQAFNQNIIYPKFEKLQADLVDYFKEVISNHPKDFYNYISLAEILNSFYEYNPNYLDESQKLTEKALELSPKRQATYYVLAKVRLLKGDVKGAYKIFEEVVNLNTNAAEPHFYFGLMAYSIGDPQKGREEIAIAEKLGRSPKDSQEFIALGNFAGDYDKNYKKAINYYKMALISAQDVNKPNILLKLAVACYFDNQKEESRNFFIELQKLVDLRKIPVYSQLLPILNDLKVSY